MGAKNVTVIPNGVDSQLLVPLSKDECKSNLGLKGNVLGYVGSLEHWVDLETVVEAMPFLDAKLMVVGRAFLQITVKRSRVSPKDVALPIE